MEQEIYDNFVKTLKSLFMFEDAAELDFGIYRILKLKHDDIENYLDKRLKDVVKSEIEGDQGDELRLLIRKRDELVQDLLKLGVKPDNSEKYIELRNKIDSYGDPEEMQAEVFTHLNRFFTRYYEDGDFISKRRYKKGDDSYAIPYSGEEVKLYWANEDQYYIKTGEYFRNYKFKLTDGKLCEFTLKDAEQDQNNNIPPKDQVRCFALAEEPIEVEGDVLHINFTYLTYKKSKDLQKKLMNAAYEAIKDKIPTDFLSLMAVTGKDSTLLQKHLAVYVAKNTCDYFIHKDLRGFLTRELDFYIKNEVLYIDDIDVTAPQKFVARLAVAKAIKRVGAHIVNMLAQLEDYQKRLWLKKKFVTDTEYCITLDLVPHELYAEICSNDRQREEWVKLFAIDEIKDEGLGLHASYSEPLTVQFLEENQHLVLDTQFFLADFKHKLLASISNIDERCNGLLINSENFQALQLLQEKYQEKCDVIYVDPPYNTSASEILYKNSYKHSSWLSLIKNRFEIGKNLLEKDGWQCTTIDDVEGSKLRLLVEQVYDETPMVVCIRVKPSGRPIPNGFAISHEYAYFSRKNEKSAIARLEHSDEQTLRYIENDEKGPFLWELLRKAGSNSLRINRPTMFYPFYLNKDTGKLRIPELELDKINEEYIIKESPSQNEIVIYPYKDDGLEGCWYYGLERSLSEVSEFKAELQPDGNYYIYRRRRKNEGVQPLTMWDDPKYSATEHGTDLLKRIFGAQERFSYPKSIYAVEDSLIVGGIKQDSVVLDYFAGSGTTAHAVINLNREDGEDGRRKYLLCEMGEYFGSVTKPRVQKVIYSKNWKDGKPVSRDGVSQFFKYIRLEQYEDTLNNIETLAEAQGMFGDDELLGYKLDVETRDTLFNSEHWFAHPFDVEMKITRENECRKQNIDIVETFNYLIGLYVEQMDWPTDGMQTIIGKTRHGESTLVVWRDTDKVDDEKLLANLPDLKGVRRIYVNGDNNLAATLPQQHRDHVMPTEIEFQRRMFSTEE